MFCQSPSSQWPQFKAAAEHYEASDTARFEIPRMLFDDPTALEEYVKSSQNKHLLKWWAQYLESSQDMEAALEFYAAAEDTLSLVRVHCFLGNVDKVWRVRLLSFAVVVFFWFQCFRSCCLHCRHFSEPLVLPSVLW